MPENEPTTNDASDVRIEGEEERLPDDGLGENPAAGAFGDVLGGLLAGGTQNSGSDPTAGLLGALLGNSASSGGTPAAGSGNDPMSTLLAGLLGGGAPNSASTEGTPGNNSSAAIAETIAAQLGIPPEMAQIAVSFVLSQLASGDGAQLAQMLGGKEKLGHLAEQMGMDQTAMTNLEQALKTLGMQTGPGASDEQPSTEENPDPNNGPL